LKPYDATGKIIWTTNNSNVVTLKSDQGVATISECLVTAKVVGVAEIIAATKDGKYSATTTIRVINAEPELIFVEGGTFTMGCSDDECEDRELPNRKVTLSSFNIAKYPVTQEQWIVIMGNNPSGFKGDNLPVENINYEDIQMYINKLNANTGKNYRLPTEAEWEYAARGGNQSKGYKYSGSNDIDAVAWYNGNSKGATHIVGIKAPNELGIYDMSGNVREKCSDWYGPYSAEPQTNPTGLETGNYRVDRGGYWENNAKVCRISMRGYTQHSYRTNTCGFRLVLP